ncbi:Ubiquitin-like domain-containing CTD phosphatase 1 [Hondaea fermentalgiana]|uniref:protein-serine/threonine phosphatase n=1 Tax=Hondaea fermentalgiana TaxID=2315210 RepID=A0A2R5G9L8_9STRA|nr:Ubiquitin-like domain-containing CTD phosphatase 1 [Hondaea fermentalgiana]|eukprot:GBG25193.1 Ubiquitin-like domain-containing CTD phosphatase 1 [Hondaea fermentalgiana]
MKAWSSKTSWLRSDQNKNSSEDGTADTAAHSTSTSASDAEKENHVEELDDDLESTSSSGRWRDSSRGVPLRAVEEGESMVESAGGEPLTLILRWNRGEFVLQMNTAETVEDLHDLIELETGVQPANQKIFGLKIRGKAVARLPAETCMGEFGITDGHIIKMMGSPDTLIDEMEEAAAAAAGLQVVDDLDFDYSHADMSTQLHMPEARQALQECIETTAIHVMNPPRTGKRLLVLDLDHTLLDFGYRKYSSSVEDLKRPFMDQFLATAYKYFDLVAWSQTRWHYVELKLTELGIISHSEYKICFALDRTSMFKVTRERDGEIKRHEVKALELIWSKFPQWSAKNTVHIDDLARNFALNPQSGLQCTCFKRRRSRAANDRELLEMAAYLEHIAENETDFSRLDHTRWRERLQKAIDRR